MKSGEESVRAQLSAAFTWGYDLGRSELHPLAQLAYFVVFGLGVVIGKFFL